MAEPLVSVIIPCYNQAHFLGEAIDSVMRQTYAHCELLVVDDGSSDDTAGVAARAGVRLLRQRNQGLSAARNVGIRHSRGDYLVFLDADDRLLPSALRTGVAALAAHPSCAFVYGRCQWISADGSVLAVPPQPRVDGAHYSSLLEFNCIYGCMSVMFRRVVFDKMSAFDTSLRACEDYDLYLRVTRRFPVHNHDVLIGEYRRHTTNLSDDPIMMLSSVLRVLHAQKRQLPRGTPDRAAYQRGVRRHQEVYGNQIVTAVRSAARSRQWRPVMKGALALLRHAPLGLARRAAGKSYRLVFRPEG